MLWLSPQNVKSVTQLQFLNDLVRFGSVWFDRVSTILGYSIPNPLYTYIKFIELGFVSFYGIAIIVGYVMLNPLFT